MHEQQVLQVLKFPDRVVRGFDSLLTLETANANTDMSCCNHIDIISSITDSKRGLRWVLVFNHVNNFCLLLGAYTTRKYNISTFAKFYELVL